MRKVLLLAIFAALANMAWAGNSQPVGLRSADDARAWEAVGRVNLIGTGFCTGTLIAPNLVLTAAHCLYDKHTGKRVDISTIEFLAGWRDGRAAATRKARRVREHRDYVYNSDNRLDRVAARGGSGSEIARLQSGGVPGQEATFVRWGGFRVGDFAGE